VVPDERLTVSTDDEGAPLLPELAEDTSMSDVRHLLVVYSGKIYGEFVLPNHAHALIELQSGIINPFPRPRTTLSFDFVSTRTPTGRNFTPRRWRSKS
jgi:hypothetical protein